MTDLDLAREAVAAALAAGATDADAALTEQSGVEVRVRNGEVEHVEESRSRGLGVRAFRGTRMGLSYTNEVSVDGVRHAARRATELSAVAAEDVAAGPPDAADVGAFEGALDVDDPTVVRFGFEHWREAARETEAAALSHAGITMSEGARAGGGRATTAFATSRGFAACRARTSSYVATAVAATGADGERQRAARSQFSPHWSDVGSPRAVGDEAARRALVRIGWRRPPTGVFPVVFAPEVARDFAQTMAQALSASSAYRRMTFLSGPPGEQIASTALTLVDDATLPRHAGSRPFDGEGVRSRRNALVERGRLAGRIADSYSARRTGGHSTGNAARSTTGATSVAPTNLVLVPGTRSPEALLADVDEGLYVTDLFHFGVNVTSGSWSRGGSGRWIERGRLAHPVQELTVAGDLRSMLSNFREAANDLEWLGACAAPTVRIDGMTVAAG